MDPLEHVLREIDDAIVRLRDAIATGSAQDFPTYRQLVGRMDSLLIVREYVADTRKRYIEE